MPELFIAGASSRLVDGYLQEGRHDLGVPLLWICGLAVLALALLINLSKWLQRRAGQIVLRRASVLLFLTVLQLPTPFFTSRRHGDVAALLMSPFLLAQGSLNTLINTVQAFGSGLLALLIALLISPPLALATLVISAAAIRFNGWLLSRRSRANDRLAGLQAESIGAGNHVIAGIEAIKATGSEGEAFSQCADRFCAELNQLQGRALADAFAASSGDAAGFLIRTSVILLGGWLIIGGRLTLGELVAFQFLVGMIETPLQQLGLATSQLQVLAGELHRVDELIALPPDPQVRSLAPLLDGTGIGPPVAAPRRLAGAVELRTVSFGYRAGEPPLFENLTLAVPAGGHLAIVGASGSGKSSVLRLIAGLYPPDGGQVLLDGRERCAVEEGILRASLAMVAQSPSLFQGSVLENITLWNPTIGSAAARQALAATELLEELGPGDPLLRPVAEGGRNLSGGQRQRLQLARALARRPAILLLDEATSALDQGMERRILHTLRSGSHTLITVAHRLQGALISDQVLVIERGRLVQQGEPADLAGQEGPFRRLLEAEEMREADDLDGLLAPSVDAEHGV